MNILFEDIDQLFITQIEQFSEGTSEEHINSLEQKFVILSADGREVVLIFYLRYLSEFLLYIVDLFF